MLLKYNTMCTQNSCHKICEKCGKEFIPLMPTTHYCSDRCSKLAYKHRKRDERLNSTTLEVRERQRFALLLTLSDAARLMQMSRNTLYKIIRNNESQLKRFTDRTKCTNIIVYTSSPGLKSSQNSSRYLERSAAG